MVLDFWQDAQTHTHTFDLSLSLSLFILPIAQFAAASRNVKSS